MNPENMDKKSDDIQKDVKNSEPNTKNAPGLKKADVAKPTKPATLKPKDPLFLRVILWSLIGIFLVGSPIAITILLTDTQENKAALQLEIQIERNITELKSMLIQEQESMDAKMYQKAYEIALEGSKKVAQVEKLFTHYFISYDDDVSGFPKVQKLFDDFYKLRSTFYQINQHDPRKLEKTKEISE